MSLNVVGKTGNRASLMRGMVGTSAPRSALLYQLRDRLKDTSTIMLEHRPHQETRLDESGRFACDAHHLQCSKNLLILIP